jgi:Asp-tRNA(Asn)/Glu-tRNA(Gln) amidotransferase A subunit family amidase
VRKATLRQGRLMNVERSEAVAKQYFEKEELRRENREFFNQVIEELNKKAELMEEVKLRHEKEMASELRKSWHQRSKFDALKLALRKEEVKLANEDLLSQASQPRIQTQKEQIREALIERIMQK